MILARLYLCQEACKDNQISTSVKMMNVCYTGWIIAACFSAIHHPIRW